MKYAIRILQNAREKLRELEDKARDAEIDGAIYAEIHGSQAELEEALSLLLTTYAASAHKKHATANKETIKKYKERCANCGGSARKCGGAKACTNAAEAPTSPATPSAKKKRGRPAGARARQQTIDDAILPHRPTDPAPPMPPLPVDAHPLDALAGRVLEQNGAAT